MSTEKIERYCEILGVRRGASAADIRQAYLDLVKVWHPDRFAGNPRLQLKAQAMLAEINEAYRGLSPQGEPQSGTRGKIAGHRMDSFPPDGKKGAGRSNAESTLTEPPSSRSFPALRFLTFWPNILFLFFLGMCLRFATLRHGLSGDAFIYFAQMSLVPLLFSLASNLLGRQNRRIMVGYIASVCLFSAVILLDRQTFNRQLEEAARIPAPPAFSHEESPSLRVSPFSQGSQPPSSSFEPPAKRAPGVPLAPRAPEAPAAPIAPVAPKAR